MKPISVSKPEYASPWKIGQVLLNEYEITGILGRGGMGMVYRVQSKTQGHHYALKTLLEQNIGDACQKASFLRELRTWVDLPDHPNLIPCCFFRTIDDRLAIFSEYAAGGSLRDWIRKNPTRSLEKILEIAIRSAWGLHAAHHYGVVHQDIKPANILMTADGVPRISDFGLARALHASGIRTMVSDPLESVLVSSSGMTTAYCSPEQAARKKLDHRTDIWSWGITILEMFNGQLACRIGIAAPIALRSVAEHPDPETGMEIPPAIVELLARCFQENPKDRWRSMAEIADRIQALYTELTGREWAFSRPALSPLSATAKGFPELSIPKALPWTDPVCFLEHILEKTNRSEEFQKFQSEHFGTIRSKLLAYLELLDQAMETLSGQKETIDQEMEFLPVVILYMQGYVMAALDDCVGAISRFDAARDMILGHPRWLKETRMQIRALYMRYQKAFMLHKLNRFPESHQEFQTINQIAKDIDAGTLRTDLLFVMGSGCNLRGIMYFRTNEMERSAAVLKESILLFEEAYRLDSSRKYQLSLPLMTLAAVQGTRGKKEIAAGLFDRVIGLREQLVLEQPQQENRSHLALAYANKALVMPPDRAEELCRKAVILMEEIVYNENATEHMAHLAGINVMLATALHNQSKDEEALKQIDIACREFDYLIGWMGWIELLYNQAAAWVNKGNIFKGLGRYDEAMIMYDQAIQAWERMIHEQGRKDLTGTVALTRINRADVLAKLDRCTEAVQEACKASEILVMEIERTGRDDLRRALLAAREIITESENTRREK
ncbi:protein kinase [bacterium]|nr:protein kinase [candidate division CSSED10-310 bacterium]